MTMEGDETSLVEEPNSITKSEETKTLTNKEQRLARKAEKEAQRKRKLEEDAADGEAREGVDGAEEGIEEEDVEAVSHKELRKRRKLEKQANRTHVGADQVDVVQGDQAGEKEWLEQNGIEGISRVHMPKGARRMEYNRGFAYVDVPSAEMMKQGVALSEGHLDGRRLLIKSGSDFGGRPSIDAAARALAEGTMTPDAADEHDGEGHEAGAAAPAAAGRKGKTGLTKTAQKILRAQKNPPGPTLFIGNLSFSATEEGVREMIERAAVMRTESESTIAAAEGGGGSSSAHSLRGAGIRKIRMGTFEDTGKCKGFGFVDFHSPAYATATLIDGRNHQLDGRTLVVQFAGADAIRRGAVKGRAAAGATSGAAGVSDATTVAHGFQRRPRRFVGPHEGDQQNERDERQALAESAPVPGSFDSDAPIEKKHKETKEERAERRSKKRDVEGTKTGGKRVKPGAALAKAQRGRTGIATDAPQAQKITFD